VDILPFLVVSRHRDSGTGRQGDFSKIPIMASSVLTFASECTKLGL